jgi:hypothetical protein
MRDAFASLNGNFGTSFSLAPLPLRTMCTAFTLLLDILGAPREIARLPFGSMRNTKTSLYNSIRASINCAFTAMAAWVWGRNLLFQS